MTEDTFGLNFTQACRFLDLAPEDFTELRRQGFVAYINVDGKQIYPRLVIEFTRQLLTLGQVHGWSNETLAWYADLVFATEIGRAILLPIMDQKTPARALPATWLETPHVAAVLQDLELMLEETEGPLIILLRSLVAATVGEGQYWPDHEAIEISALYPIIGHFETLGVSILGQQAAIARDAGPILLGLIHTFTAVALPISKDLGQLISAVHAKLKGQLGKTVISSEEQTQIAQQSLIAVDGLYASKATEIHDTPATWQVSLGILQVSKRTIALQMKVRLDSDQDFIDNVIDMIRPFVGTYGARVVHLLYEIANDPPYWRNPQITLDTNELLDRLGLKRDDRGIHRSKNRERLRDALNTAHNLEIVGEYTTWENGKTVRKVLRRTVLSLIGATYDAEESHGLSTTELLQRGLPKSMQIKLNFYDGVRRPDGQLGNQYVMMPRLTAPDALPKANYAATHELLRAYLLFRYRQTRMENRTLTITRQTALEKAGIRTKHITRATQILRKALDRLVVEGTIESFSAIPLKAQESFTVTLTERVVLESSSE